MTTRVCKLLLLIAIAVFYSLIVFDNVTDFDSNYQLVRHVLTMDTTFPHNRAMWRAIPSPLVQQISYMFPHVRGRWNYSDLPDAAGTINAALNGANSALSRLLRMVAHASFILKRSP